MLTEELEAKVSWENGVSLSGKVSFSYLEETDPWLLHAVFEVATVREDYDIERAKLSSVLDFRRQPGEWFPVGKMKIGVAEKFIRFRLTDPQTKAWADFDVPRIEMARFIGRTADVCDYESEKAALASYVDKALQDEMGDL
jgi:hypothetical protein